MPSTASALSGIDGWGEGEVWRLLDARAVSVDGWGERDGWQLVDAWAASIDGWGVVEVWWLGDMHAVSIHLSASSMVLHNGITGMELSIPSSVRVGFVGQACVCVSVLFYMCTCICVGDLLYYSQPVGYSSSVAAVFDSEHCQCLHLQWVLLVSLS